MMKLMSLVLLTVFSINAFAVPMNAGNKEKQAKKKVALFVAQVQATQDVVVKEKMLNDFLTAFDQKVLSQDTSNMSAEEAEAVETLRTNLFNAFDTVKGGSAEDLNAFASYLESEMNQASAFVIFYIILLILFVYYGGGNVGFRVHIRF